MKRASSFAAAAFVICLTSSTTAAEARFSVPLPVTAQLCREDAQTCETERLPPGADLNAFAEKHRQAGERYRLTLQLPAGEFALHKSWLIDGADIPQQIVEVSIVGEAGTRLSGSPTLEELGARGEKGSDGAALLKFPRQVRERLMSLGQYGADGPAWPVLQDAGGELRMTRWPAEGWGSFSFDAKRNGDRSITPDRDAPLAAWHDESSAWVLGFFRHGWHADYTRLADVRADARMLRLGAQPRYGVGDAGRFRVLNLRSGLRRAGDYWIDAVRGEIHAITRDSAPLDTLRLSMLVDPLLHVRGARHVRISGLSFTHTRGHAVLVENATGIELSRLRFEGIGRNAVVVEGGRDVLISGSSFVDTGSHAVVLRGGDRMTLQSSGHRLEDSRIRKPSQRLATPATAIRLEGVGHVVRGNTIEEAPHSAVYFDGNNHLIEANWIERVCLEVDDAGAIYAGRDWTYRGNIIRRNVIAALPRRNGNANLNAVYLDDMLSGAEVDANLVYDVPRGVLVGGGRDNRLENNLFVRTQTPFHIDQRALEWASPSAQPGGVMLDRLSRVPYRNATWRRSYPVLPDILAKRPAAPLNNVARANSALDSGAAVVAPAAASGQVEIPRLLGSTVSVRGSVREFLRGCASDRACATQIAAMRLPGEPAP